jgi:hypothetical protein
MEYSRRGTPHISQFLSALATEAHVSAATQNQALSAVLFLYRAVLAVEVGQIDGVIRASTPTRLPVVLTRNEVAEALGRMTGVTWLVTSLLYGSGLVFHGSAWHSHTANVSSGPRRSLQGAFIPRDLRAGTDFAAGMQPETRARLGPLARQVLAL